MNTGVVSCPKRATMWLGKLILKKVFALMRLGEEVMKKVLITASFPKMSENLQHFMWIIPKSQIYALKSSHENLRTILISSYYDDFILDTG
jgi:hypothetical protein